MKLNDEIEFVALKDNLLIKRKYFYKHTFPEKLDEPFLLMNGRLLSLQSIADLIQFHEEIKDIVNYKGEECKFYSDKYEEIVELNQKFLSENL